MKIVFRVDASLIIGTGHVMRCLTLANALKQQGAEVEFTCREHVGNLIERIEQQGFKVYKLTQDTESIYLNTEIHSSKREKLYGMQWLGTTQQQDAEQCKSILDEIQPDWLIVDHYAIDQTWQTLLKESCKKLMVIDDLADRQYQCDILLDQTYGRKKEDYLSLVPKKCQMLLGPQYALLRPEFAEWRDYSLKRRANPELKKLLITMGGVDPDNITDQVLEALKTCDLPKALEIIVVMGETAPNIDAVKTQAKIMPYTTQVKTNVNNMAELMANSDLAIGAAGATTWERCCLGLPTIQIILADNQKEAAINLARRGAILTLKDKFSASLKSTMLGIMVSIKRLEEVSVCAAKITNGTGCASVVRLLNEKRQGMKEFGKLRDIKTEELSLMLVWRNVPKVRENMYTRHEISSDEHQAWWASVQKSSTQKYFMYEFNGMALGVVCFSEIDQKNHNASWAFYASPEAPKGTGSRMEFLALDYAFNELGMHKLCCEVLAFNNPVIKLHKRFGFQSEGVLREHHDIDGVFVDIHRMGILSSEWSDKRDFTKDKLYKFYRTRV